MKLLLQLKQSKYIQGLLKKGWRLEHDSELRQITLSNNNNSYYLDFYSSRQGFLYVNLYDSRGDDYSVITITKSKNNQLGFNKKSLEHLIKNLQQSHKTHIKKLNKIKNIKIENRPRYFKIC